MSSDRAQPFEQLVAQHERDVLRVCRSVLRDEHLGLDAAQDVFVRLWRALAEGRGPEAAAAWLRRTAVSASLDLQRRRDARPSQALANEPASRASPPEASSSLEELERCLERAVHELPEGQRTIFRLRHDGGFSLAEIAETLDLALSTVKTQFARACLKLQHALRAFEDHLDGD